MARSVVDLDKVKELKSTISSYSSATDSTIASFRQQAMSLLAEMEEKLSELERIKAEKEAALDRCEVSQKQDEDVSCAAEESAYNRACKRWQQCEDLVVQACAAIEKFDSFTQSYRSSKQELVTRANSGLTRIEGIINNYLTDGAAPTTGGPVNGGVGNGGAGNGGSSAGAFGVGATAMPNTQTDDLTSSEEPPTAIHVSGGDQIGRILPKGSSTDPVLLDPDTMAHKFDGLPPVTEVSHDNMRLAASGILSMLAAGGAAFGMRQMLLRQKTDELFEKQYGITSTELLLSQGEKRDEYVKAYNDIYRGIKQEMIEVQKEEISSRIEKARDFLDKNQQIKERSLHWIEMAHEKKVELQNDELRLASLTDGKPRRLIGLGQTRIGGLSEEGLSYMMDQMGSNKDRFITVSNILAASDVKLTGDDGRYYTFSDDSDRNIFFVAHDGSVVDHYVSNNDEKLEMKGPSFKPKAEMKYETTTDKDSDIKFSKPKLTIIKDEFQSDGVRVARKHYAIDKDGTALATGIEFNLGLEAKADLTASLKGFNVGGEASLANAGAKRTFIRFAELENGEYSQVEFGVSGSANFGVALSAGSSRATDGTREIGVKLPGGKVGIVLDKLILRESDLPASIRERLK